MTKIRIGLAQINPTVGDLKGNADLATRVISAAKKVKTDLVVFPEMVITGYPPEDLVLRDDFVRANLQALGVVSAGTDGIAAVVGHVDFASGASMRRKVNAASLLSDGKVLHTYHKRRLPNYSVFDEQRTFAVGQSPLMLHEIAGVRVGYVICEDAWYEDGPIRDLTEGGADLIVVANASPYFADRIRGRIAEMSSRARENDVWLAYVNMVGGQDELVFDGGSMIFDPRGDVVASAAQFDNTLMIHDLDISVDFNRRPTKLPVRSISSSTKAAEMVPRTALTHFPLPLNEEIYTALKLATRDYVKKTGFTDVIIGLSGGVDSSIVAAIAVDALGSAHVHGVLMPSGYTSGASTDDALELARRLRIDTQELPIIGTMGPLLNEMRRYAGGELSGIAEENIQSRIRGTMLMGIANNNRWMVLTTGNKSETAVGYSTLYGDTAGGYAVIKDVLKTRVYDLCRWRNDKPDSPIPINVLTKPPSAELRPDQKDTDSLPDYEILDPILRGFVEEDLSASEIVAQGFEPAVVARIVRLVNIAEYKRRQSPPGPRVSQRAFGRDRRIPIANHFDAANDVEFGIGRELVTQ